MPMVLSSARCAATDALVIGYGSDLRGDDAAGRIVAEAIEAHDLDGIAVVTAVQLTPELALAIAGRDVVVFVDASIDDGEVTVRDLAATAPAAGVMTHHADPATLLSMVPSVGNPPAAAYLVSIPARNLDLGTELSETTARAIDQAVDVILGLVLESGRESGPESRRDR
jgi:hydrogenase maturation protease